MHYDEDHPVEHIPDTIVGLFVLLIVIFLICGIVLTFLIGFLSILFWVDYLFLGSIIHWSIEGVWGLMMLFYCDFTIRWSVNPTDWIPIHFGHKIEWYINPDIGIRATDTEISKWVKENVSSLLYAKQSSHYTYYFLRRSDYIAFKLRWL